MKLLLDGKKVAENIKKDFENRIENLKQKPNVAVLGIDGDEASLTYVKRIEKNCGKYHFRAFGSTSYCKGTGSGGQGPENNGNGRTEE